MIDERSARSAEATFCSEDSDEHDQLTVRPSPGSSTVVSSVSDPTGISSEGSVNPCRAS
jgi:hypothetical protein